MTASGQLHGRHWAGSHGRRQIGCRDVGARSLGRESSVRDCAATGRMSRTTQANRVTTWRFGMWTPSARTLRVLILARVRKGVGVCGENGSLRGDLMQQRRPRPSSMTPPFGTGTPVPSYLYVSAIVRLSRDASGLREILGRLGPEHRHRTGCTGHVHLPDSGWTGS